MAVYEGRRTHSYRDEDILYPPTPEQRSKDEPRARKKRSANHIKSRPANPAVISSIIDSFEALGPSPTHHPSNDYHSDTGSLTGNQSRPYSSDGAAASAPSIARSATSPGFGMEYGRSSPVLEEVETADAAPPPSIRTSRPPSGLSHYTAVSPRHSSNDVNAQLRPVLISSRKNSYSSLQKEKEAGTRNKHSAESWIKRESINGEALSKSGQQRRSLRRINSQETLRQTNVSDVPLPIDAAQLSTLSRAEQIIARNPPPAVSNRGRLYLTESNSSEERVIRDSLISDTKSSEVEDSPESELKAVPSEVTSVAESSPPSPKRLSPGQSVIGDSIPTRTSSLRATSKSPASDKKRDRRAKRMTVATSQAEDISGAKNAIPESSWADLGDDDETVKRIRELREQRRSRIEESRHSSLIADVPQLPKQVEAAEPVFQPLVRRSEDSTQASSSRPAPNRASTDPAKAHKVLGIFDDGRPPSIIGRVPTGRTMRPGSISPEKMRHPPSQLDRINNAAQQRRPGTSGGSTPTPPLSLDYSYAQAVDALSGAEHELEQRPVLHSRQASKTSFIVKAQDLSPLAQPEKLPYATAGPRPKSARRRPDPSSRWTHHPDLPLDSPDARKNRRKSMSDARRTRHFDEEQLAIQRRDSIEDAVMDFLKAPRLSRKVKHPKTGRLISFSEVGDPNGSAVFICVGMGLTRYVTAFYDELATTLRLRLITVDRPGVGGSQPYPAHDRTGPLNWPEDVLTICQYLNISSFSLLAHSAGAIYALATALILPHLINGKVHLLAPWIPPSQLEAVALPTASAPPAGALPRSQRILRVLPTSFLKAANSSFMTATSASLKPASKRQIQAARERQREQSMSPTRLPERPSTANRPDYHRRESMMLMDQFMPQTYSLENFPIPVKELDEEEIAAEYNTRRGSLFLSATATPTDPTFEFAQAGLNAAEHAEKERKMEFTSRLTERTWELATRDSNPATDLLVCLERNREIGFRYTDVTRQVVITHGSEDKRVPLANVKWLGGQMNARAMADFPSFGSLDSIPQSREGWVDQMTSRGGCEVRILEGEGHGLMASAPIMSDVLTEIAGYFQEKRLHAA
jgi:pimeloyl-ACP methyl ester carboxylesterase